MTMTTPYETHPSDMEDDELGNAIETNLERYAAKPMEDELLAYIATLIEPHTTNNESKHRDVMECINVAYPIIVNWLREHGLPDDTTNSEADR